jgi:hypothetical protein
MEKIGQKKEEHIQFHLDDEREFSSIGGKVTRAGNETQSRSNRGGVGPVCFP